MKQFNYITFNQDFFQFTQIDYYDEETFISATISVLNFLSKDSLNTHRLINLSE